MNTTSMDLFAEELNFEKVNRWDMVQYLSTLGFEPQKVRGEDYWYLSPLRTERTPSFKVFRKANVWFDHGIGAGGSMVDFCLRYFNCGVKELLQRLSETAGHQSMTFTLSEHRPLPQKEIEIVSVQPILSTYLQHYFRSRHIPLSIGQQHCREVRFSMHRKKYFAIGFPNRSGGFELRNAWFKGSSSPKDLTLLQQGSESLAVFEGFFDFLSYETALKNNTKNVDILVLNSLSFVERAMPLLRDYRSPELYLDRGNAGRIQTQKILHQLPNSKDKSDLYKGFEDLNEWHCTQQQLMKNKHSTRLKRR